MPTQVYTLNTTPSLPNDEHIVNGQAVHMSESVPTGNFAGLSQMSLGSADGDRNNAVFWFSDIRYRLPAGAVITSATLRITAEGGGFNNFDIQARQCLRDWWRTTVSWDAANRTLDWDTPGGTGAADSGPRIGSPVNIQEPMPVDLDVTAWATAIEPNREIGGILVESIAVAGDAFRFFTGNTGADGDRPELYVTYTGGTAIPPIGEGEPITFTGNDGDPPPAPFVSYQGAFEIQSNALEATGPEPGGIGWVGGYDSLVSDGTIQLDYVSNGSTGGDAIGLMFRRSDNDNFTDIVHVGGGQFSMVEVVNGVAGSTLAAYTYPGYDGTQTIPVAVHLDWDEIRVDIGGVTDVMIVENAAHHAETIHGVKYGSAGARIDNLTLPSSAAPAIVSIVGTIAPGENITINTSGLEDQTAATIGGEPLVFVSAGTDTAVFTIPTDIDLRWTDAYTVSTTDGTDFATLSGQNLLARTGWGEAIFSGVIPDPNLTETFYEICVNSLGFTPVAGDQVQFTIQDNFDTDVDWLSSADDPTTGIFAVYDQSTGRTTEYRYYFGPQGVGLGSNIINLKRRREQ